MEAGQEDDGIPGLVTFFKFNIRDVDYALTEV